MSHTSPPPSTALTGVRAVAAVRGLISAPQICIRAGDLAEPKGPAAAALGSDR